MMQPTPKRIPRRKFLQMLSVAAGGSILGACSPSSSLRPTSTPTRAPVRPLTIQNQSGSTLISDQDDLVAHLPADLQTVEGLKYQWSRNTVQIKDAPQPFLSNPEMKTFVPFGYYGESSHTSHTIHGYTYRCDVLRAGDVVAQGQVVIRGPKTPLEMRGFNFVAWEDWYVEGDRMANSLKALKDRINVNWVSLWPNQYQDRWGSDRIFPVDHGDPTTLPDDEYLRQMQAAHDLGLKVGLYPQLWLIQPNGERTNWGRGDFTADSRWFQAYTNFITSYADLAERGKADLFVIGVELAPTVFEETGWRNIITEVRKRYSGPITYAHNFSDESQRGRTREIKWFDQLDYLGFTVLPEVDKLPTDPHLDELVTYYESIAGELERLASAFSRPVLICEAGFNSADGTARGPWLATRDPDFQEQADCYDAFLEVFGSKDYIKGIFWNQWLCSQETWSKPGRPAEAKWVPYDLDVVDKPAERVVASWYGSTFDFSINSD